MHVLYNCLELFCKCITLYTPKIQQGVYVTFDYLCTSYELSVAKNILQSRSSELAFSAGLNMSVWFMILLLGGRALYNLVPASYSPFW